MRTVTISHVVEPVEGVKMPVVDHVWILPDEFVAVIEWLCSERAVYQPDKWDYAEQDFERAKQGLTEDSWMWQRGVENYAGRVRACQAGADPERDIQWYDNPIAIRALLKLVATMACIPEHLLRGGAILRLPKPGVPSGVV